jgi:hypothetical protein
VQDVLGRLGEDASFEKADRSFTSTEEVGDGEVRLSFVVQSGGRAVELLISHRRPAGADGDNFAVLARRITELGGGEPPTPPYPRPVVSSPESLADVLRFGFEVRRGVAGSLRP